MNTAEIRRDAGIARAAARADRECPKWTDTAYQFLVAYCRIYGPGHELHCEAMRELAVKHGAIPEPPDGRAWGHVFRRAARAGLIRKTGRYVLAKSSNLSPKPIWAVL
jgi:hypothetical protein